MKIAIYAQDGSPLGVTPYMIDHRGVGGAELSMMTWAETMAHRGHSVTVYNNPETPIGDTAVSYKWQWEFNPAAPIDVFIVYRSPNEYTPIVNSRLKVHWSTDQQTIGNYAKDIVPHVDQIVCISPRHLSYYQDRYQPPQNRIRYIDLGVRASDYEGEPPKRNPKQFIFCSVPQRGLMEVAKLWPKIIERDPACKLVITSDYTLWGTSANNGNERARFMGMPGVKFLGAIPRAELAKHQQESGFHLYPCIYDELFCISVAETQYAGAIPLTSDMGAIATTNEWGHQIEGNPENNGPWHGRFLNLVLAQLKAVDDESSTIEAYREQMIQGAKNRFSWERICDQWELMFAELLEEKEQEAAHVVSA